MTAGILLGLTAVAHLIFGYMGAVSLALAALLPDREVPRKERLIRLVRIGLAAFAISAYQLAPLLIDSPIINHSRWEAAWKWDGFGVGNTLNYLLTGQMLDVRRIPVLSLAALAGAILLVWRRFREKVWAWVLASAAWWIAMLFGRPFWGPVLPLLGVSGDMHLHRVAAGAQVFLLLLGAIALGECGASWRHAGGRRWRSPPGWCCSRRRLWNGGATWRRMRPGVVRTSL